MPRQYPVEAFYPAEAYPDFAGTEACCVSGDHDSHAIVEEMRNYPDFSGGVLGLGAGPSEFSGADFGDAFSDFRDKYLAPAAKGAAATVATDLMADPTIQATARQAATETIDQKVGKFVRTNAVTGLGILAALGVAAYLYKRKK